jgi:2-methylcitrate dehydratase PrpD
MDITHAFAARIVGIGPNALGDGDHRQLSRLILDYCAVAYGGTRRPWIRSLHAWAAPRAGSGPARLIGSDLHLPASDAALVNGAAGHSFELDDTHDASMSHPGAVVIPTALAVAVERAASGADLLAAIVAGYETMTRIGVAASAGEVMRAGYHPTALFGVFGAAAAAGRLLGLDADAMVRAWGHALSLAAGSMQFSQEETGAEVKRVHAGYAARNGILAAEMAAAGIEAPHQALTGRYGFLALYGHDPRPERLVEPKDRFSIHEMSLKPYACCRLLHSMIDGLRSATDDFSLPVEAIRSIVVRGPGKLAEQHMVTRPKTSMAAQYSLPYTVGATLAYGPERFSVYDESALDDPQILAWTSRISVERDLEIEAHYPEHFGTEVTLTLSDGTVRTERVLDSIGTPTQPMSLEVLVAKARGLIADVHPAFDLEALQAAIDGLRHGGSANALQDRLGPPPGTPDRAAA